MEAAHLASRPVSRLCFVARFFAVGGSEFGEEVHVSVREASLCIDWVAYVRSVS